MKKNSLANESSLYLKQHENNPVEWWPYTESVIKLAQEKDLPIFLSIGYSSCHWCHVMAHESFEDESTAKILNENFICIKVDREEFPDIDQYYQLACQVFGRQGGWPLSALLLPNMQPFFVGTYFPSVSKYGMPSFKEVLNHFSNAYKNERKALVETAFKATEAIKNGIPMPPKIELGTEFPHPSSVMHAMEQIQDWEFGGYGKAPKFPHFAFLEWAIEQIIEGKFEQKYGDFIIKTLDHMCFGGINDHCKGGFHRYSVDQKWLVPHFEKMLYDQAGFLKVLAKTSLIYPSPLILDSLFQTLDYIRTEMKSDEGYFFSAQDADSEGHEGLYFTFTEEEFREYLLEKNDDVINTRIEEIKNWFQISKEGNFDNGLNVISLDPKFRDDYFQNENWDLIRKVRKTLLENRKMRIPPGTDNKGIAGWNFMLLSALADVTQYCKIDGIRHFAKDMLFSSFPQIFNKFLVTSSESSSQTGEVLMSIKHTTTKEHTLANLEDYVFFVETNLRIYELSGNDALKDNAYNTAHFIIKEFYKDGELYSRPVSQDNFATYPNIPSAFYDTSYISPISSLIHSVRRLSVLFSDLELLSKIEILKEKLTQFVLNSPVSGGEGLRALTYPKEIYRVLKIPKKWIETKEWWDFNPNLLSRFVMDFHDEKQYSGWQICDLQSCVSNGKTLDELISTLVPKKAN